jgi:hypothetical protein
MCGIKHCPVHHQAQSGCDGGLRSQPQQRELSFAENAGRDLKDKGHDHIGGDVWQNVGRDDTNETVAGEFGQMPEKIE